MSPAGYIVQTFVTLALVCVLAVVVLWAARRAGVGRATGPVELVGRLPLEARRSIYLVRVGEIVLVVGAGEGGFTKLAEVPASTLETGLHGGARDVNTPFGDVLLKALGAKKRQEKA
ncbi:MAG: flagellar biosynthetic protein FliO [Polyangiaceae bacterium]